MRRLDIKPGQRFGKLIARHLVYKHRSGKPRIHWECQCDCGKLAVVEASPLVSGRTKSCGCWNREKEWKGYGDISGHYWNRLRRNASKRGYDFPITIEQAWKLFEQQQGLCSLTGRKLVFNRSYLNPRSIEPEFQNASLDRIDSKKGYEIGNVQWVDVNVNYMKMDMSESSFVQLCQEVVSYANHRKQSESVHRR